MRQDLISIVLILHPIKDIVIACDYCVIGEQLVDNGGSGVDVIVDTVEKDLLWIYDEPFVVTDRNTVDGNSLLHTCSGRN